MAVDILGKQSEIVWSRKEMQRRGLDSLKSITLIGRILRKLRVIKGIEVGDTKKSWDVLKTIDFLESNIQKNDPILDIGAFGSEILLSLNNLHYTNLTGIDLNSRIFYMPKANKIKYICGDFLNAPLDNQSYSAVTAISVIEHGFNSKELLNKLSHVIKLNGFFIASVDYWPDKISTNGIKEYGLDWTIFSKDEIMSFIKEAEMFGFKSNGHMNFSANEKTAEWNNKSFTFAWLVLEKVHNF